MVDAVVRAGAVVQVAGGPVEVNRAAVELAAIGQAAERDADGGDRPMVHNVATARPITSRWKMATLS